MATPRSAVAAAPVAPPPARSFDEAQIVLIALACWAVALPMMVAFNVAPSATFLNQAAAFIGWGALVAGLAWFAADGLTWPALRPRSGLTALVATLALLIVMAVIAWAFQALPAGLALSPIAGIAAGLIVLLAGAALGQQGRVGEAFHAFCTALVVAGVLSSVVGLLQVFAPQWTDGNWIAGSAFEGRASGNLRQPNHLSSLLLWSMIALAWLYEAGRLRAAVAVPLGVVFMWTLVLSASRTGMLGVLLLLGWGVLGGRRPGRLRLVLISAPALYALWWLAMALWAHESHQVFGSEVRLTQDGDISSSRFRIWSDTLGLIAQHPWTGVGFGNFNFAWSLTPFPNRPVAFFDHTHNLPLQFAVELGLPMAALLLVLLVYALVAAWAAGRTADVAASHVGFDRVPREDHDTLATAASARSAALMIVLMMALHSQLEYPLWYGYFLLPTLFAFGLCLGVPGDARARIASPARTVDSPPRRAWSLFAAGVVVLVLSVGSVVDYLRVVVIFSSSGDADPLNMRIADGTHSWLFDHHAHYAAVTTVEHPSDAMASFPIVTHYLLDTRLMTAWARAYHEQGDDQRARYLAQRLREFHNADSKPFFEPCDDPPANGEPLPFQCTPPTATFTYQDFE